jgi:hypothetical protein
MGGRDRVWQNGARQVRHGIVGTTVAAHRRQLCKERGGVVGGVAYTPHAFVSMGGVGVRVEWWPGIVVHTLCV